MGIKDITGKLSNRLFRLAADMDAKSMYPSIIQAYNITPEAEVGTISYTEKDPTTGDVVDKTDQFVDDYLSNNGFLFAQKYMNLPGITEMNAELHKSMKEPTEAEEDTE